MLLVPGRPRLLLKPGLQTTSATFQIAATVADALGSAISQGDQVTDFHLIVAEIV